MKKAKSKIKKKIIIDDFSIDADKYNTDSECPCCYIRTNKKPEIKKEQEGFQIVTSAVYQCHECNTKWKVETKRETRWVEFFFTVCVISFILGLLALITALFPFFGEYAITIATAGALVSIFSVVIGLISLLFVNY